MLIANVISASLMFDEASDIQMNKHLNIFVNVLLNTGDVKTLTLACIMLLFIIPSLSSNHNIWPQ
jgi:hypothetical protein